MMLFYDFEVFKYDWLVVIYDTLARKVRVIVNDPGELSEFHQEHISDVWTGFNSRHYDQYILKGILCGFDAYKINDWIVNQDKPGWEFSRELRKIQLYNYDVYLATDVGLKAFEGYMGNDIRESSVPFNINRKLTEEEIEETIKYCRHDVEQTMQVFMRRTAEFNTMMYFIKHFNLPMGYISKTKAQLAAEILGGNRTGSRKDQFKYQLVPAIELKRYKFVKEWYENSANHDYKRKQENIDIAGVPHTFAWGGGHGGLRKYHGAGVMLMIDVTAYYPSLQKRYHFGYRVMDHPENFEYIHNSNLEFKAKGDKAARQPFKIMDNAISGQMKQESSALFDPKSNNEICINGQLLLLDLIEHLEDAEIPEFKLIQNNTDGILVMIRSTEEIQQAEAVVHEWEKRTGMSMSIDVFEHGEVYQKDVNNYILVNRNENDEITAIKSKGGYVMPLNDLSYDLPIINKALREYFLSGGEHGVIERVIYECRDLKEFQLIARASRKYSHIEYNGEPMKEKVLRVFASNDPEHGGVKKIKLDTGRPAQIPNSPEHCRIYTTGVNGVKVPAWLDYSWYVNFAKKRAGGFGAKFRYTPMVVNVIDIDICRELEEEVENMNIVRIDLYEGATWHKSGAMQIDLDAFIPCTQKKFRIFLRCIEQDFYNRDKLAGDVLDHLEMRKNDTFQEKELKKLNGLIKILNRWAEKNAVPGICKN